MRLNFKEWLFIAVGFSLGSCNMLYSVGFYVFLLISFIFNLKCDFATFRQDIRREWRYLIIPLVGVIYLLLHYLLSHFWFHVEIKPAWGIVELLILYFFFVPLYVLSARSYITTSLLRLFLVALCWGILLFNFVELFYLAGLTLFTDTSTVLKTLYAARFGGNIEFLGGQVYLEAQALYLCISALIGYFFILKNISKKEMRCDLITYLVIFILSLIFLSFTVTKSSILAFLGGCIFLSVVYFRKMSQSRLLILGGVIIAFMLCGYLWMPDAYVERVKQAEQEIQNVRNGEFSGGSIVPRIGLFKENFEHLNEFGILGLGVYKSNMTRNWYESSSYNISGITNAHNSFIEFWLIGGIAGLLFILYYFFYPIWIMLKKKEFSFLMLAIIVSMTIANSTCVLAVLVDSNPLVLFMLSMAYFYFDCFLELQRVPMNKLSRR